MAASIGIDVGTTNVKVVAVDADGAIVASHTAPLAARLAGDTATLDPHHLWDTVLLALAATVADMPGGTAPVRTLGVCSQYSSIVPVDATGTPLADMVLYLDHRGTGPCHQLLADDPEAFGVWMERHGLPPVGGGLSLGHMLWFQHHQPEVHRQTAAYLEPMDYVTARLTGRICATQGSVFTSQLVDNRILGATAYDDELVRRSGIDPACLPPLVAFDAVVGTVQAMVADRVGLPHEVAVRATMNDSHAGALATGVLAGRVRPTVAHASGALETGASATGNRGPDPHASGASGTGASATGASTGGLMVGTTAVLLDRLDTPASDLARGVGALPGPTGDAWVVWAENGLAGRVVDHVLAQFVPAAAGGVGFGVFESALAAVPPGCDGVVCLPWMAGAMAPVAAPGVRGGFVNVSLATGADHLVRAAAEGVAHNARWLLGAVEDLTGRRMDAVVLGGGAARSTAWAQVFADVMDRTMLVLADPGLAAARAVALAARLGPQEAATDPGGMVVRTVATCTPDPAVRTVHDDTHDRFLRAFDAAGALAPEHGAGGRHGQG